LKYSRSGMTGASAACFLEAWANDPPGHEPNRPFAV
jgi:hypothetical protein